MCSGQKVSAHETKCPVAISKKPCDCEGVNANEVTTSFKVIGESVVPDQLIAFPF